ncbi:hypothetical protein HK096_001708 [Nowakowskiella sp. JEL0078]|nr:hypothetical protein HK096_001708 [Nowakowskiella sp. JEL0078]
MDRLHESQTSDKKAISSQQKSTLIRVLKHMIDRGTGISGLTILEILETLVKLLIDIAKISIEDPANKHDLEMVIRTIGKLSSHLQYPEQLNDIFAFILNRLRVNLTGSPVQHVLPIPAIPITLSNIVEVSDMNIDVVSESDNASENGKSSPTSGTIIISDPSTIRLRAYLFQALEDLVQTRIQTFLTIHSEINSSPTNSQFSEESSLKGMSLGSEFHKQTTLKRSTILRNPVNYDVVVPMVPFLVDDEADVRLAVSKFLISLVSLEAAEAGNPNTAASGIHKLRIHVHRTIHLYLQRNSLAPFDYAVLLAILTQLAERHTYYELVEVIPLLYSKALAPRFLQVYFGRAANFCDIEGLNRNDGNDSGDSIWSRIAVDSLESLKDLEFSKGEEMYGVWLTRQEVVKILEADKILISKVPLLSDKLNAKFGEGEDYLDYDEQYEKNRNQQLGNSAPSRMQRRQSSGAVSSTSGLQQSVPRANPPSIRTNGAKSVENLLLLAPIKFDELKDTLEGSSLLPPVPPLPPGIMGATPPAKSTPKQEVSNLLKSISNGKRINLQPSPEPQMNRTSIYSTTSTSTSPSPNSAGISETPASPSSINSNVPDFSITVNVPSPVVGFARPGESKEFEAIKQYVELEVEGTFP